MSWTALETTASQMRDRESLLFGNKADADVKALKKDLAKEVLRRDIADELKLAYDDDAAFDTFAVDYAVDLRRALALQQLHLYFVDQDTGAESVNRFKAEHYGSLYQREQARFKTLGAAPTGTSTSSETLWR